MKNSAILSKDNPPDYLLKLLSLSIYLQTTILLLHFLAIIRLPVALSVFFASNVSYFFYYHLINRSYTPYIDPNLVQSSRLYMASIFQRFRKNTHFPTHKPTLLTILHPLYYCFHVVNSIFSGLYCFLDFLYFSLRYALIFSSAVLDQIVILFFLVVHSAFEASIPAHGAILGTSSKIFASLSCLFAGAVEVIGEHDPLFKIKPECRSSSSVTPLTTNTTSQTSVLSGIGLYIISFIAHMIFAAVVLIECIPIVLAYFLASLIPNFCISALSIALISALCLSYASVFSTMLHDAWLEKRTWHSRSKSIFMLTAFAVSMIFYFEFFAHMVVFINTLPAIFLAYTMGFGSSCLLLLAAIGDHHHSEDDHGIFTTWTKFFASIAVGIIAGHEFYEFLLAMHVAPNASVMVMLVSLAIISGFVVEGAFFGSSDDVTESSSYIFLAKIFTWLFPAPIYVPCHGWGGTLLLSYIVAFAFCPLQYFLVLILPIRLVFQHMMSIWDIPTRITIDIPEYEKNIKKTSVTNCDPLKNHCDDTSSLSSVTDESLRNQHKPPQSLSDFVFAMSIFNYVNTSDAPCHFKPE